MFFSKGNPYRNGIPDTIELYQSDFITDISSQNLAAVNKPVDLNILVYMAADYFEKNGKLIAAPMFDDIMEMKEIGSSERINILAFFDGPFISDSFFARLNNATSLEQDIICRFANVHSNSTDSLVEFIKNSAAMFPAKKNILILSSHGKGWGGLLPDQEGWRTLKQQNRVTFPEGITLNELIQKNIESYYKNLNLIKKQFAKDEDYTGIKFDIVAMDACSMANLEALSELRDICPTIIASELPLPGSGYPYNHMIDRIKSVPFETLDMAKVIIETTASSYRENLTDLESGFSLIALKSDKILELTEILGTFSTSALGFINRNSPKFFTEYRINNILPTQDHVDLIHFMTYCSESCNDPIIKTAAQRLIDFWNHSGIVQEFAAFPKPYSGLTLYFPTFRDFCDNYQVNTKCALPGIQKWKSLLALMFILMYGEEAYNNPLVQMEYLKILQYGNTLQIDE